MELTPQDIQLLRNVIMRAVNDGHDILKEAARRQRVAVKRPEPPPPPSREPTTVDPPRKLYSTKEAAYLLSISHTTIWRMVQERKLCRVKIGSRSMIEATEIERLIMDGRSY